MKRKLVTLLMISTLLITTGCSMGNDRKQEGNTTVVEEVNQTKLIELHEEMLPKIRDIYDGIGINYGETLSGSSGYDGVAELFLEDSGDEFGNEVFANYNIRFDNSGKAKSLGAIIVLSDDAKNAKDGNYDIENSIFNEFAGVMIGNDVYKSDVKTAIENYYTNFGESSIKFEYDNSILDIGLTDYEVYYQITMKS